MDIVTNIFLLVEVAMGFLLMKWENFNYYKYLLYAFNFINDITVIGIYNLIEFIYLYLIN